MLFSGSKFTIDQRDHLTPNTFPRLAAQCFVMPENGACPGVITREELEAIIQSIAKEEVARLMSPNSVGTSTESMAPGLAATRGTEAWRVRRARRVWRARRVRQHNVGMAKRIDNEPCDVPDSMLFTIT